MATKKPSKTKPKGKARKPAPKPGLSVTMDDAPKLPLPRPPLSIEERMGRIRDGITDKPIRVKDIRAYQEANRRAVAQRGPRPKGTTTAAGTQEALMDRQEERKALFLETFVQLDISLGTIVHTCNHLLAQGLDGFSINNVKRWRKDDEEFAKQFMDALDDIDEALLGEQIRRGAHGWEEPVFGSLGGSQGESYGTGVVGTITKYSDPLLIEALRQRRQSNAGTQRRKPSKDDPTNASPLGSELTDADRVTGLAALLDTVRARLARQTTDSTQEMGADL